MGIPDLPPDVAKWIIGGLLAAICGLWYLLKEARAAWREDKIYYQGAITRLENILERNSHEEARPETPRTENP